MATIEDLLLEIFSHYVRIEGHEAFLRNIPRVCKTWNELSSRTSLWRNVRTDNWNFLLNVSRRGLIENTQSLDCYCKEDDDDLSDRGLSAVLKSIRDLKALDFRCYTVHSDVIKLVTEHCPHLERLRLRIEKPTTSHDMDQFLTVCGPTLKDLHLTYYVSYNLSQKLVTLIDLERLSRSVGGTPFPIYKLRNACPKLRELKLSNYHLITAGRDDSSGCGFKDLRMLKATCCDFSELDLGELLKDSMDLEHLELQENRGLAFNNILKIPSDKVRILNIVLEDPVNNLNALTDAVFKWRCTLSILKFKFWEKCNIDLVLKLYLQDNPNPQLEMLAFYNDIDPHLLVKLIRKCQNLIQVETKGKKYEGREEIERTFGISH